MRRAQAWKGSTVQEAWATPISPASWVEWASTCTRYSPARLSGARGGETVRATGAWPLGLSWIFSLSPVRRASPEIQARGTPSTLTWKWSTMVPRLATVPRTTSVCPGVRVTARWSRSICTRPMAVSWLLAGSSSATGCSMRSQ